MSLLRTNRLFPKTSRGGRFSRTGGLDSLRVESLEKRAMLDGELADEVAAVAGEATDEAVIWTFDEAAFTKAELVEFDGTMVEEDPSMWIRFKGGAVSSEEVTEGDFEIVEFATLEGEEWNPEWAYMSFSAMGGVEGFEPIEDEVVFVDGEKVDYDGEVFETFSLEEVPLEEIPIRTMYFGSPCGGGPIMVDGDAALDDGTFELVVAEGGEGDVKLEGDGEVFYPADVEMVDGELADGEAEIVEGGEGEFVIFPCYRGGVMLDGEHPEIYMTMGPADGDAEVVDGEEILDDGEIFELGEWEEVGEEAWSGVVDGDLEVVEDGEVVKDGEVVDGGIVDVEDVDGEVMITLYSADGDETPIRTLFMRNLTGAPASLEFSLNSTPDLPYDLDGNEAVGFVDLAIFSAFYQASVDEDPAAAASDFNGDGSVTAADFSLFSVNFLLHRGSEEVVLWSTAANQTFTVAEIVNSSGRMAFAAFDLAAIFFSDTGDEAIDEGDLAADELDSGRLAIDGFAITRPILEDEFAQIDEGAFDEGFWEGGLFDTMPSELVEGDWIFSEYDDALLEVIKEDLGDDGIVEGDDLADGADSEPIDGDALAAA